MSLRVDSTNQLLALRTLRIGRGCWGGGGLFIPSDGFLHPLIFPLFLELLGLSVGHIAELLHPSGKHFRCEHAVVLVGGDARPIPETVLALVHARRN